MDLITCNHGTFGSFGEFYKAKVNSKFEKRSINFNVKANSKIAITHSSRPMIFSPCKKEIFKSMEDWVKTDVLTTLKPVEISWQPQDVLPEPSSEAFLAQVGDLRERAREIPDDYFVVLVGDMITEEALPTYQTFISGYHGVGDKKGYSQNPWEVWNRSWSAEENRHGDLLNKYLYLSGRVNMKSIEKTIHYLIGSGMDVQTDNNPYFGFVYTSFQERATFISHSNTAKLAHKHGDTNLAKICGLISSDEKRHETAYTKIVGKLFEIDPNETILAFATMMKRKITMPAHLMYDGEDDELFNHFSAVAERLGVYTSHDYANILEFLVKKWEVEKLCGLSSEGREAQEYVCELGPRFRKLAERVKSRSRKSTLYPFGWIFKKEVKV